jgi:hypothetical protein
MVPPDRQSSGFMSRLRPASFSPGGVPSTAPECEMIGDDVAIDVAIERIARA